MTRHPRFALARRLATSLRDGHRARRALSSDRFRLGPRASVVDDGAYAVMRTMIVVRPDLLKARLGGETLAVCGAARGMTSVASFALFEMGLFLGERLQQMNLEDVDMREAIPPGHVLTGDLTQHAPFRDLVAARNARYGRWGFKLPHASDHVPALCATLRAPVVMLCIRNPVGTARSVVRRTATDHGPLQSVLHSSLAWMPALHHLLARQDTPALLCDMDEARHRPGAFVNDLRNALDLDGDAARIAAQLGRGSYKRAEPRRGMQFV